MYTSENSTSLQGVKASKKIENEQSPLFDILLNEFSYELGTIEDILLGVSNKVKSINYEYVPDKMDNPNNMNGKTSDRKPTVIENLKYLLLRLADTRRKAGAINSELNNLV